MDFIDDKEKIKDLFNLSRNDFLKMYSYLKEEEYDNTLDKMWEELGDIPVNEKGTKIEQDFYIWKNGTNKEDIWHWFDNRVDGTRFLYMEKRN